jgi:hypothetical protein
MSLLQRNSDHLSVVGLTVRTGVAAHTGLTPKAQWERTLPLAYLLWEQQGVGATFIGHKLQPSCKVFDNSKWDVSPVTGRGGL